MNTPPRSVGVREKAFWIWLTKAQQDLSTLSYETTQRLIPGVVFRFMQEKRDVIQRAFDMKGGSKGWLQVELSLAFEDV